jgi:RNA polymerase sigma factor (sigma-70 family)
MTPADPAVGDLVLAARKGEADAWDALVHRFAGRVRAVTRTYRLNNADAEDVFQVTWLRLVSNLDSIREPDRVGAWLVTTATHECLRVLRRAGRHAATADGWEDELVDDAPEVDTGLQVAERDQALWTAMGMLSAACQRLLRLMATDPAPTYEEISDALQMPMGSIGPTRRRCLTHLRGHLARITGASDGSPG